MFKAFRSLFVGDIEPHEKKKLMKKQCYVELGESVSNMFIIAKPIDESFYDTLEATDDCLESFHFG
jgi:hypothetical protein